MNSRTTLLLVLCALLVGGFVVWDHYRGVSTETVQQQRKRLLDIKAADITRLELVHSNQTIVVEKTGDQWQLKQPLVARADDMTVRSLLDELEFAERMRTLTAADLKGVSAADFGLTTPRVRVALTGKQGAVRFALGNYTPTKDALYFQVTGSPDVCVIGRSLLDVLNTGVDNLRSRSVLDFTPATVTRLEIKCADRLTELARTVVATTNGESRWTITKPVQARADQNKVSELLTDLGALRVQQFVSDDPKDVHTYQLDDPAREVTVSMGDNSQTLLLGRSPTNDANQVYAKRKNADSIFTVPAAVAQKFAAQINDLRDPRVLPVPVDDVRGIELRRGDDKITLIKDAAGWQIATPLAVAAASDPVTQLLDRLTGLSVAQFTADVVPDLDKYGLAVPTATVSLQGQGTNVLAQLLIGSLDASNGLRYVKRADEPFIYGVTSNLVDWLPARALALRTPRIAVMRVEQLRKLTIQKGGTQTVLERDAQNNWKLVLPPLGPEALNTEVLTQVVNLLAELRATEFVREGRDNLAQYGLDAPGFAATLQVGDKTHTLTLGKPVNADQRYAFWSDPPLVFTISTPAATTLLKDFVTRSATVPASVTQSPAAAPTNAPPPTLPAQ